MVDFANPEDASEQDDAPLRRLLGKIREIIDREVTAACGSDPSAAATAAEMPDLVEAYHLGRLRIVAQQLCEELDCELWQLPDALWGVNVELRVRPATQPPPLNTRVLAYVYGDLEEGEIEGWYIAMFTEQGFELEDGLLPLELTITSWMPLPPDLHLSDFV